MRLNKKTISILIIALLLILSNIAYAKPFTDAFSGGLLQINNFFTNEQYKPYAKTIDFFFFALLFIAVYMMGVRYAFKEVKRPEQVIAILLGLMTAFLLVLGGFSATLLLPYIQWLLYVLLFILYWWMLKGIKNKFWRFVLALLLTLLTIAGIQWLFSALAAPEVGAVDTSGIAGFFKSLGDAFKGIELPAVAAPGVPQWLQDLYGAPAAAAPTGPGALPTIVTPTVTPEKRGWLPGGYSAWNLVWIVLLIAALAYGVFRLWPRRPREPTPPEELKDKIIKEIQGFITKKEEAKSNIEGINREKNRLIQQGDTKTGYIAKLREILRKDNGEDELANLFLDESRTLEDLEESNVKKIIQEERKFVQELKKLRGTELKLYGNQFKETVEELNGHLKEWQTTILENVGDDKKKPVKNMLYLIKVLMDQNINRRAEDKQKGIIWLIAFCYNLEKKQNILARELQALFEDKHIKDLVKGKFTESIRDEASLEAYNRKENEIIALLLRRISEQVTRLEQLKRLIEQAPQQAQAAPPPPTPTIPGIVPPGQVLIGEPPPGLVIQPSLSLNIKNPKNGSTIYTGEQIKGLQVEIKDEQGNIVDLSDRSKVPERLSLRWYLSQAP